MSLRIVYVGELSLGAVCRQRQEILAGLGHEMLPVSTSKNWTRWKPKRILDSCLRRIDFPLDLVAANHRLLTACSERQPDVVWIDKGLMIYPSTILTIKRVWPQVVVVNFNPDDPFASGARGWRWHKQAIPHYDYCFVPRAVSVGEYLAAGAKRVHRFYWGFSPAVHMPMTISAEERRRLGGSVGFIGTFENDRAQMIASLAKSGVQIRVWGDGWSRLAGSVPNLTIEGRSIWDKDFVRGICSFDINLCFLNKLNRDTLNTRCLAIPASGSFLLAERTSDLQELFREGEEAEFFASSEELGKKVAHYLGDVKARERIAQAGREKCLRANYSNEHRLKEIVAMIEELRARHLEQQGTSCR